MVDFAQEGIFDKSGCQVYIRPLFFESLNLNDPAIRQSKCSGLRINQFTVYRPSLEQPKMKLNALDAAKSTKICLLSKPLFGIIIPAFYGGGKVMNFVNDISFINQELSQ